MASDTALTKTTEQPNHPLQAGAINAMPVEDKDKDVTPVKPTLLTIPPELQTKIFKLLDPASSTCLGITNRQMYRIHWDIVGKVPLNAWVVLSPNRDSGVHLFTLLARWAGPGLVIDKLYSAFLTQKQYHSRYLSRMFNYSWYFEGRTVLQKVRLKAEVREGGYYQESGGVWREGEIDPSYYEYAFCRIERNGGSPRL